VRRESASRGTPFVLRFYNKRFAYILAVPLLLYEGLFLFYPMAEGIRDSLSNVETGSVSPQWVGLANYQRMFSDPVYWQTIQNTVMYAAAVIVLALSVALGTALLMNRTFRGRAFFRAVLTTPWAFPDIPTAIAFVWMMSPPNDVVGRSRAGYRVFTPPRCGCRTPSGP
jgi:multiple sugar transport system permease protein